MPTRWPFTDDRSLAVISLKRILGGSAPVLLVTHDDDGSWQFLDGADVTQEDAALLALEEMIDHDPTLIELAALPLGFYAARESVDGPWQVAYNGDPDDDEPDDIPDLHLTS